jgi:hypothetical protein
MHATNYSGLTRGDDEGASLTTLEDDLTLKPLKMGRALVHLIRSGPSWGVCQGGRAYASNETPNVKRVATPMIGLS